MKLGVIAAAAASRPSTATGSHSSADIRAPALRSRDGRLWRLDASRSRLVRRAALRRTCLRSRSLVVGGRRIAGPAAKLGSWQRVYRAPDGRTVLALWSGECEIPTAYLVRVRDGRLTSLGSETTPLGWTHDGRAVVQFANGCGSPPDPPGVYLGSAEGRVFTRALTLPRLGRAVAGRTS